MVKKPKPLFLYDVLIYNFKLHDEIFVLRSKTTSAAAEKRQGRTISLPGTPAEKHGYVMNNKSLTYNQSNIKKNNKNNNNNNVSSALSNGAMFAKRLWRGATSDTTSKTKAGTSTQGPLLGTVVTIQRPLAAGPTTYRPHAHARPPTAGCRPTEHENSLVRDGRLPVTDK